jgi:hypothetical protein
MCSRHRLAKLLLRQGIFYDATTWTAAHAKQLRSRSFDKPGVQFAFGEVLRHRADDAGPKGPVGQRDPEHGRRTALGARGGQAGSPE